MNAKVPRRVFLTSSLAAGGGLLLGYSISIRGSGGFLTAGSPQSDIPLNAWIRISSNDELTLISSQSEMGRRDDHTAGGARGRVRR